MTLIVGELAASGVCLVSDTRLTGSRSGRFTTSFAGVIKLVVLHPNLVVGFAGDSALAMDTIRGLGVDRLLTPGLRVVEAALRVASTSGDVEFVMGTLDPAGLVEMKCGRVVDRSSTLAYLGAPESYSYFQRELHEGGVIESAGADSGRLMLAMKRVVASGARPDVGGTAIDVVTTRRGFSYASGVAYVAGGLTNATVAPSGKSVTLPMTIGASVGSHTESVLAPLTPGLGVVGLYIMEARRGALWWPQVWGLEPHLIPAKDQEDFVRHVKIDYGVALSSPRVG